MFNGEYKVGEVFQCGLLKLKAVEWPDSNQCTGCDLQVFADCHGQLYSLVGLCSERKDNKNVIFRIVEE